MSNSNQLSTVIELVNNRLHFNGMVEGKEPVSIDYTPPLGDNLGYTSLELFLISFSTCVGSSVLTFLRRMNKQINAFKIQALGCRREEHPTCFKNIELIVELDSPDISEADFYRVLKLSEDTYCPVWAMIKGNVEVTVTLKQLVANS
jgi:putative redox protein